MGKPISPEFTLPSENDVRVFVQISSHTPCSFLCIAKFISHRQDQSGTVDVEDTDVIAEPHPSPFNEVEKDSIVISSCAI
jgi:hypothetical protein